MRSLVTVRGLVWNSQYSRPEFLPRLTHCVVKGFVTFGGFEHVEGFALVFPCSPGSWGIKRRRTARNGANANDCGENRGGAEAARLFQSLLGCQAGEALARD